MTDPGTALTHTPSVGDRFVELIRLCQQTPFVAKHTCPGCDGLLDPVAALGQAGEYVFFRCPDCRETYPITDGELLRFRAIHAVIVKL